MNEAYARRAIAVSTKMAAMLRNLCVRPSACRRTLTGTLGVPAPTDYSPRQLPGQLTAQYSRQTSPFETSTALRREQAPPWAYVEARTCRAANYHFRCCERGGGRSFRLRGLCNINR